MPALGALAAVLLAGALGAAASGAAAPSGPAAPAAARLAAAAPGAGRGTLSERRGPDLVVEAVNAVPSAAESAAPRSSEPQPLLVLAAGAAAVVAVLATRLGRRHGAPASPWGRASTSTRGPPVLQPA